MSCPRVLASTSSTGSGNGGLGSYHLTRVGSQNLPVADLTSAHVVSTVTLPIAQYTYAYDYPVSYTHTHTFDNFFKDGRSL